MVTPKTGLAERAFRFHYSTSVTEAMAAGGTVELWVPLPSSGDHQRVGPVEIESGVPTVEAVDPLSGNRMLHAIVPRGSPLTRIVTHFDVHRARVKLERPGPEHRVDHEPERVAQHLAPNARVPTGGFIAEQARSIADAGDPPTVQARKLFEHLMTTMEYDSAGCTPARNHQLGDLAQACDLRSGTCTEFHGLYVGYARALGIPARFQFGFNIPYTKSEGVVAGYHCWAEIFLPRVGWFPVDITEAIKERARDGLREDVEFYFGGVDCHRFQVSTGRDLALLPPHPAGLVDKLIFSHAVRGGEAIEPELAFSFSPPKTA